jgi:hypothetical protein
MVYGKKKSFKLIVGSVVIGAEFRKGGPRFNSRDCDRKEAETTWY